MPKLPFDFETNWKFVLSRSGQDEDVSLWKRHDRIKPPTSVLLRSRTQDKSEVQIITD